jgi:phosphocarrier protein HPr
MAVFQSDGRGGGKLMVPDDDGTKGRMTPGVARITVTLGNRVGLHARPAGAFVRVANGFKSQISVICGDKSADGKRIMGVLSLDADRGASITIEATGDDAAEAVRALQALVADKFGEAE